MHQIINSLFQAADNHAEDTGEADHAVGDLQGLLTRAWDMMSISQRRRLLESVEVEELVDLGSREEVSVDDLVDKLDAELKRMSEVVTQAGYHILANPNASAPGFYWKRGDDASEDFYDSDDAIVDAHRDFLSTPANTEASAEHDVVAQFAADFEKYSTLHAGVIGELVAAVETNLDACSDFLDDYAAELKSHLGARAANAGSDDGEEQESAISSAEGWVTANISNGPLPARVAAVLWMEGSLHRGIAKIREAIMQG